jgi:4-coumarate--CoA ligase
MAQHVTRHKWLTGGVKFVDVIPKNPVNSKSSRRSDCDANIFQSGKILRKLLRDLAKEEIEKDTVKAKL